MNAIEQALICPHVQNIKLTYWVPLYWPDIAQLRHISEKKKFTIKEDTRIMKITQMNFRKHLNVKQKHVGDVQKPSAANFSECFQYHEKN